MARLPLESDNQAILAAIDGTQGAVFDEIQRRLPSIKRRTLQDRLRRLVKEHRLRTTGTGSGTRYWPSDGSLTTSSDSLLPLSTEAQQIRAAVSRPLIARTPAGYDRTFLEGYVPNQTHYLSLAERAHLLAMGRATETPSPIGTYAREILGRLLIDLSWNSSRLEGNTYSLLDTQRLIELGQAAEGKDAREATMILNHKAAIEFLVENLNEVDLDPITVRNLHALLSADLLADATSPGRLRRLAVGIKGSVFHPLSGPQVIEDCFQTLLAKASAISDPFEQAFFMMVQLPYLQPFDDVNKRVSRLAANLPLLKNALAPISFTDVPGDEYVQGILAVYELRRVELLRDVFLWAYERSAAKYAAQPQSMGEPDPFRLRHRQAFQTLVGALIREDVSLKQANERIIQWATDHVASEDRPRFVAMVEEELLSVSDGNFARYGVRPSEYKRWNRLRD
ncbi:MAG: Fic family protein [Myxococcaceae bacterium]